MHLISHLGSGAVALMSLFAPPSTLPEDQNTVAMVCVGWMQRLAIGNVVIPRSPLIFLLDLPRSSHHQHMHEIYVHIPLCTCNVSWVMCLDFTAACMT